MKKEFFIHFNNGYSAMLEQYKVMYEQLGTSRFLPDHKVHQNIVYDIKDDCGKGTIQVFMLLGNLMLSIYDFIFYDDIITVFDLSNEYFEIEYCIDGCMYIEEENIGDTCFGRNQLSISLPHDMKGIIKRRAGQKYQGISITANKSNLSTYFGSSGFYIWNTIIDNLQEYQRSAYYLGQNCFPEIATVFCQIYNCRLPVKSRILFYESKIMEVLSLIMSHEEAEQEHVQLTSISPYELQKIKEIPLILWNLPFEQPNLLVLANRLSINPKKLEKGFKLVYGDTIFSYCRRLFLKHAASLLLETDMAINEIAYVIGYSTPSNFCVAFKKQYGFTPLKYREASLLRNIK